MVNFIAKHISLKKFHMQQIKVLLLQFESKAW